MVLAHILTQRKFNVIFALSVITSVLLGTYTLRDFFHEFEDPRHAPAHLSNLAVAVMHLTYGGTSGEAAAKILTHNGGAITYPESDPHDTGLVFVDFPECRLVSARGCRFDSGTLTESASDFLVNAQLGPVPVADLTGNTADKGFVHRGYAERGKSLLATLTEHLSDEKPTLFLGHSMGGSTMLAAGWMAAARLGLRKALFATVGSPPIFSRTAATSFAERFELFRVYDKADPTPHLDTYSVVGIPFAGMKHPEGLTMESHFEGDDPTGGFAHGLQNYAHVISRGTESFRRALMSVMTSPVVRMKTDRPSRL